MGSHYIHDVTPTDTCHESERCKSSIARRQRVAKTSSSSVHRGVGDGARRHSAPDLLGGSEPARHGCVVESTAARGKGHWHGTSARSITRSILNGGQ